jgi:hypothetical protein
MTLRTTHLQMALQPLASPERAYMKDQFPFLGIAAPVRRAAVVALVRNFIDTHGTRLSALTIREGSKHLL